MKRLLLLGAVLACVVWATEVPRQGNAQTTGGWTTFHGDGQRSGAMNVSGPKDLTALQSWQLPAGIKSSPAVGPDGVAYIGDDNGKVYALDPAKPSVFKWTFATGGPVVSSPSISKDGSTIFVGSDDGSIYALSAADGHKIWSQSLGAPIRSSPLVSPDGSKVVINNVNGTMVSLNTTDGSAYWTAPCVVGATPGSVAQSSDGSRLYVATSTDTKMYGIPASTGCGGGNFTVYYPDAGAVSTPAIDANGNIWINTINGAVFSFTPQGTPHFANPYLTFNQTPANSTEAFGNSQAVIGTGGGLIVALNIQTGQQNWQYQTNGAISSSAAIATGNGQIYIGSSDGFLYCLDQNGNLINKRDMHSPIYSSPAITADGFVWAAADDGEVDRLSNTPLPPTVGTPPATTVPQNTATPTAPASTSTPVATNTPVPPTSTPTPTATATSVAIPLSLSMTATVKDGKKQTITVTSAPNTTVKIRVTYPNGDHQSHSLKTNASGKGTYTYTQGGSKMTHTKLTVKVTAKVGGGSSASSATKTYKIAFGTLDVSAEPRTQSAGKSVGIFIHARTGSKVSAYLLAPTGRLINLDNGHTGPKGFATFHYTIAKSIVTSKNRKVVVIAKLGGATAKTTFNVA